MVRRHPCTTRSATLFHSTTLFRSHVPALRAAGLEASGAQSLEDVAIAHRHLDHADAASLHSPAEPEVRHDRDDHGVAGQEPPVVPIDGVDRDDLRSEEHTSELQSLMRISYAVFCLKKKNKTTQRIRILLDVTNKKSK